MTSCYSSSEVDASGRLLCFALRPAGFAFSSGLAWAIGWPGGASGLRIEPTIDFLRFLCFACEDIASEFGVNSEAMLSPLNAGVNRILDTETACGSKWVMSEIVLAG